MDIVKVALIVGGGALILTLTAAVVVAWANAASRNLALATGTLAAAAILFVIQLAFELQGSRSIDHVSFEFTVDRSKPSIRQWNYTDTPGWRIGLETGASDWLVKNSPTAFDHDRDRLTSDFALFSLISFLAAEESDWQLRKLEYKTKGFGSGTLIRGVSRAEECSLFTISDLRARLSDAGNVFADAPLSLIGGRLCLPPKSMIEMSSTSLMISNPVCRVSWQLDQPTPIVSHVQPGTGGQTPTLPSGEARLETRMGGFNVEVTYLRWHANRRDMDKYRAWTSRVLADSREWFEGQ